MRFQTIPYLWILTAYCRFHTKEKKKEGPSGRRGPGGKGGFRGSPPENKEESVDSGVDLGGY